MNSHKVDVLLNGKPVGSLAEVPGHRVAFSYGEEWLQTGFSISPFSLPLQSGVLIPPRPTFRGLWGVFADSLPDAWGRLLVDRLLQSQGRSPGDVSELERLMIVGESGSGALSYHPAREPAGQNDYGDLDELCDRCAGLLNHEYIPDLDELFALGGSSGGARPKICTDEWIIKFPASREMGNVGLMEKEYMDCAASCGIEVPETKLLPSRKCAGYFAVRRFDRRVKGNSWSRIYMLSAAALLEADWRSGTMDYQDLMKLTNILSRSNKADLEQMYRRMCFNVFGHNRDDHLKNFSWLYDEADDCWHPSPAYDLTWSSTWFGEHTLSVHGNSKNPGMEELIAVGKAAGLPTAVCAKIAKNIQESVSPLEAKYRYIRS